MKAFIKYTPFLALLFLIVSSCGVNNQLDLAKAFEDCKYDIISADSVTVAGTDVSKLKNLKTSDLAKMPRLALAFINQNVPLRGVVNLRITNPTNKMAGINQFEYKVIIRGQELANGFVDRKVSVDPNGGTTTVPIKVNANIYSLLSNGNTLKAITEFISSGNAAGSEVKETVTIKIKPTLDVAGKQVQYPGYISIDKEVSSKIFKQD